jgi:RNA polymerase sigma factor (sigma-70 family)
MVNTATSWFRRRSWRNETATADPMVPGVPDRSEHADHTDRLAIVAALARLPPRQRAVVVLRFYEDLSVEQTAEVLSVTVGTVKSQTSHALAKLRVSLGDAFVTTTQGAHHE